MVATFPKSPQTSAPPKHTGNTGGHSHHPAPPRWALPTEEHSTGLGRADGTLCPRRVSPQTRAPPCSLCPPRAPRSLALPKPRGAARSRGRRRCQRRRGKQGHRWAKQMVSWCLAPQHPAAPEPALWGHPCVWGEPGTDLGEQKGSAPCSELRLCRATSQPGTAAGGPACAKGDTRWGQGAGANWGQVQSLGGKATWAQHSGSGREGGPAGTGLTYPPLPPRHRVTLARPPAVSRSPVRRASHPGEAVGTERCGTELLPCRSRRQRRAPWRRQLPLEGCSPGPPAPGQRGRCHPPRVPRVAVPGVSPRCRLPQAWLCLQLAPARRAGSSCAPCAPPHPRRHVPCQRRTRRPSALSLGPGTPRVRAAGFRRAAACQQHPSCHPCPKAPRRCPGALEARPSAAFRA